LFIGLNSILATTLAPPFNQHQSMGGIGGLPTPSVDSLPPTPPAIPIQPRPVGKNLCISLSKSNYISNRSVNLYSNCMVAWDIWD